MRMTASEAFQKYQSDPGKYILMDVRTPGEYKSIRIKGSQNIDFYDGFERHLKHLDKGKAYLLFCASGGRSQAAAGLMRAKGFEAYNIGGVGDLIQAGFEYERG